MYPKISVASPAFELYVPVDDFYGAFLLDSRCATFRTAVPTLLYVLSCVVFLYYAVVPYRSLQKIQNALLMQWRNTTKMRVLYTK